MRHPAAFGVRYKTSSTRAEGETAFMIAGTPQQRDNGGIPANVFSMNLADRIKLSKGVRRLPMAYTMSGERCMTPSSIVTWMCVWLCSLCRQDALEALECRLIGWMMLWPFEGRILPGCCFLCSAYCEVQAVLHAAEGPEA